MNDGEMGAELKPCPFCGAEPNAHTWQWRGKRMHKVRCERSACLIRPSTNGFDTPGEAAAAWNARHEALQYARLAELTQAEKDGRLVVMPCKVGDLVYQIAVRKKYLNRSMCTPYIKSVEIKTENAFKYMNDIGKTVFLTREEAEAALKKRGED